MRVVAVQIVQCAAIFSQSQATVSSGSMRKRDEIVVSPPLAIHNGATSTHDHDASGHSIAGAKWKRMVAVQIVQ